MKSSISPTLRRGNSWLWRINIKCSLRTKKEWLTAIMNQEHILSINRHRSYEVNKKCSVYPTPKIGDLTYQGDIESYLSLLGGNHRLVAMLARHSLNNMDVWRLLIHLGISPIL